MATITPPPRPIPEPPTPRHNPKEDINEPHLRRRSSRLKSQRTPSPGSNDQEQGRSPARRQYNHRSLQNLSPPSSPISSTTSTPRRKQKRQFTNIELDDHQFRSKPEDGSLITPSKTPSKMMSKQAIKGNSRLLFPGGLRNNPEDVVPRRGRRKSDLNTAPEIPIFTDINARVPELDESDENVFYDPPEKRVERAKTRAKRMEESAAKRAALNEELDHDEGMSFTFRGKKFFRKYEEEEELDPEETKITGRHISRKITPPPRFVKTSFEPRTLFPDAYIEDLNQVENPGDDVIAAIKSIQKYSNGTPTKQEKPITPPPTTSSRITRSTKLPAANVSSEIDELSTTLFSIKKGKKSSVFDEWSRTKDVEPSGSQEKKRKAESSIDLVDSKKRRRSISK